MKKILVVIFLLSAVVFSACRKDKYGPPTVVDVTFRDYWTGQPIDSADVYVYINKKIDPLTIVTDTVAHLISDANGHVHSVFLADEKAVGGGLMFDKLPWYEENGGITGGTILPFVNNNLDLKIKGYGFVKVHVKNIAPFDSNDFIQLDSEYDTYSTTTGAGSYGGLGMGIDTTVLFSAKSINNQSFYVHLYWSVEKNAVIQQHMDSVWCSELMISNYNLNY